MCLLPNDRLTNRLSVPKYVYHILRTGLILNNLYVSAGFSGSAPIAIGGGTVSDLFSERDRASAMALYTFGPLLGVLRCCTLHLLVFWARGFLGPAIGPVAGGFITEKLGIKWVFIVLSGSSTTISTTPSANIIGLSSDLRCCKPGWNSLFKGNLCTCHPTEKRSATCRSRSHCWTASRFTRNSTPCVVG